LNADGSNPIEDSAGNRLDGEWTNPTSTTQSSSSTYPSGNGAAGGNFLFRFNVLPGDALQEGTVDNNDLGQVLKYFNKSGSWTQGDFDGNGTVDNNDLGVLLANYNKTLPSADPAAESFPAVVSFAAATMPTAATSVATVPSPAAALTAGVGDWSSPPVSASHSVWASGFSTAAGRPTQPLADTAGSASLWHEAVPVANVASSVPGEKSTGTERTIQQPVRTVVADRARAHDAVLAGELVAPSPSEVSWFSDAASDPRSRHPARDLESLDAIDNAPAAYDDEPCAV
jgi:hypothetical protein